VSLDQVYRLQRTLFTQVKPLVSRHRKAIYVAWVTILFRLIEHDRDGSIGAACRDRPITRVAQRLLAE
jgi:hypothetical protein